MISIVTKKELRYFRETVERQTLALREADARADAAEEELRKLKAKPEKLLHCSFCAKDQNSVRKLIAGPTVFICNECVAICVDICMGESKP